MLSDTNDYKNGKTNIVKKQTQDYEKSLFSIIKNVEKSKYIKYYLETLAKFKVSNPKYFTLEVWEEE